MTIKEFLQAQSRAHGRTCQTLSLKLLLLTWLQLQLVLVLRVLGGTTTMKAIQSAVQGEICCRPKEVLNFRGWVSLRRASIDDSHASVDDRMNAMILDPFRVSFSTATGF
jgi:hypothetical protein